MDKVNVMFDPINIDCSKAEAYFKNYGSTFSGLVDCNFLEKDGPKSIDNFGNTVYLTPIQEYKSIKYDWKSSRNEDLIRFARLIEENISLITQIEYSIRKILPVHTEKYLKNVINYFEYCASCISLMKNDIIENNQFSFINYWIYFDDNKPLWEILYEIALFITSGKDIITLYTSVNTTALSLLLCKLFCASGFDSKALKMLPVDNLKTTNVTEKGTIFVVFENCDLDSAVDCLIKTLYPFDYCSPLYLKQIFVQESVMKDFGEKLKDKIIKLETLYPENVKITAAMKGIVDNMKNVLKFAIDNNIKHIPMPEKFYGDNPQYAFKPLILLDNCLEDNLWENIVDKSFQLPVGLQAFRTTKEVLNLVKKSPCFGVSIWCDNSSVTTEMALLADVNCVWENSCGQMSAPVGWNVEDGNPIIANAKLLEFLPDYHFEEFKPVDATYGGLVEKSTKLQEKWKSFSSQEKISVLMKAITDLKSKKDVLINIKEIDPDKNERTFDEILKYLHFAINICKNIKNNFCLVEKNKIRIEMVDPLGIIGINADLGCAEVAIKAVIGFVLFGNSIILSTSSLFTIEISKILLSSGLPVLSFNSNEMKSPIKYDILKCFLNIKKNDHCGIKFLKHGRLMLKVNSLTMSDFLKSKESLKIFSQQKLIWKTYGETFAL